MPFISITKPVQGDATKKATFADPVIDDLNFLYNRLSAIAALAIPNSSFEADTDADNLPDQWTRTLYTGGSFTLAGAGLADTECRHGRRAIKFTSPGGAGNGGGYIDTDDLIEVTPLLPLVISFLHKASAATMRNKVDILFFDAAQVAVSTVSAYTSITNPTTWTRLLATAAVPATARYFKIRLIGGENTTTVAGDAYFDNVEARQIDFEYRLEFRVPGTHKWTCPADRNVVLVECYGAGGGSGSSDVGNGGGGGGGGGYCRKLYAVTPGTTYTITIGAGGNGGTAGGNGTNGGNTVFDTGGGTPPTANGGTHGKGRLNGSTGGAGGSASNGEVNTTGGPGQTGGGSNGGDGGPGGNISAWPDGTSGPATAGTGFGAGAAGAGPSAGNGAPGSDGVLVLRF